MSVFRRFTDYMSDSFGAASGTRSGRQNRRVSSAFVQNQARVQYERGEVNTEGQARFISGSPRGINPADYSNREFLIREGEFDQAERGDHDDSLRNCDEDTLQGEDTIRERTIFQRAIRKTKQFLTASKSQLNQTFGINQPRSSSPIEEGYQPLGSFDSDFDTEFHRTIYDFCQQKGRRLSVPDELYLTAEDRDSVRGGSYHTYSRIGSRTGSREQVNSERAGDNDNLSENSDETTRSSLEYSNRINIANFEVGPVHPIPPVVNERINKFSKNQTWPRRNNPLFQHAQNQQQLFQNVQQHIYDIQYDQLEPVGLDVIMNHMQPPIFDPGNPAGAVQDPHSFLDFYHRWTLCQPGAAWDNAKKIQTIPMFLRGGALFFFQNYEREKRHDNAWAALTWEQFCNDFIAAFPSTSSPFQMEHQLRERKMAPSESLEAYFYSMMELINRVDPDMSEGRKITTILSGLPQEVVQFLSVSPSTGLAELKRKILSISQHRTSSYANMSPAVPATTSPILPDSTTGSRSHLSSDIQNLINEALRKERKSEKKFEDRSPKKSGDLSMNEVMNHLNKMGLKIVSKGEKRSISSDRDEKSNKRRKWRRGSWDNRRDTYPQQQPQVPYSGHVNAVQPPMPYIGHVSAVTESPFGYGGQGNYPPQAPSQFANQGSYYDTQGNQQSGQGSYNQSYNRGGNRGRGSRGNRGPSRGGNRGGARGRGGSKGPSDFSSGRDSEGNPVCFNCGKPGHFSRECRKPRTGSRGKN